MDTLAKTPWRLGALVALMATFFLSSCSERQPIIVGEEEKQLMPVAAGADGTGSLEGKVTCNGNPLDGGVVKIWQGAALGVGWIQADGSYRVDSLPEGRVQISIAADHIVPKTPQQRKQRKALRDPDSSDLPPHLRDRAKALAKSSNRGTTFPASIEAKQRSLAPETMSLLEALQQKYGSPATSNLEFRLKSGTNIFNIELHLN